MSRINSTSRAPQATDTSSLPPLQSKISISASPTLGTATVVVSATPPTSYTTIPIILPSLVTEDGTVSTTRYTTTSVVTDPAVYSSLSAAATASHASEIRSSSSANASPTKSSASTSAKSSSNLSTVIPAVVVPVVVILVATLAAFWFYMRRRHRRDLQNQPAFVMAAKTEKLTSTTNSLASGHQGHGPPTETNSATAVFSHSTEKPLPSTRTRDVPPRPSDVSSRSPNYSRNDAGVARTSNVREEQRPSPLLPPIRTDSSSPNARHITSFASNTSPTSNYSPKTSRSANPHLGPQTPHNSVLPEAKNNISGRGPPAGVGTSSHVLSRNRSQSLTNPRGAGNPSNSSLNSAYRNGSGPTPTQRPPTAPNSGFRGPPPPRSFSPAGQQQASRSFSPISNRAPPPPPIKAPTSSGAFINQPQYSPIIRDVPKAKRPSLIVPLTQSRGISTGSHTSPLLPSPQSENRRDHNLTAENLRIARLANTSRLGFLSPSPDHDNDNDNDYISEISSPEDDEPEADTKSDVSSLNELEKFNFERDTRSTSGSALGTLSGARNGSAMNNSPILRSGHENPWK